MSRTLTLSIELYDDHSIGIKNECCEECFNNEIKFLYEFLGGLVSNHDGKSPSEIIDWSKETEGFH
jgi:hypothetical protein